jgi:hypothetical protein
VNEEKNLAAKAAALFGTLSKKTPLVTDGMVDDGATIRFRNNLLFDGGEWCVVGFQHLKAGCQVQSKFSCPPTAPYDNFWWFWKFSQFAKGVNRSLAGRLYPIRGFTPGDQYLKVKVFSGKTKNRRRPFYLVTRKCL